MRNKFNDVHVCDQTIHFLCCDVKFMTYNTHPCYVQKKPCGLSTDFLQPKSERYRK